MTSFDSTVPEHWYALTGVEVPLVDASLVPVPVFSDAAIPLVWSRVVDFHLREISFSTLGGAQLYLTQKGFVPTSIDPLVWTPDPPDQPVFVETTRYRIIRIVVMRVIS